MAAAAWRELRSDPDAQFDRVVRLDAAAIKPQVTWGTSPEMVVAVDGTVPDPDEEQEWNGLDERKPGFDAGVSMLWETGFGELNIDLLTDASNKSKGQEAVFAYAYPISQGRWTLRPEIGVSWKSSDLVDYYFGVDAHESRVGRAAYEADATLTPFAGVQFEYALYERTQLLGGVGVARLGDGINDSPIVDDRGVGVGYLGLSYSL